MQQDNDRKPNVRLHQRENAKGFRGKPVSRRLGGIIEDNGYATKY